MPFVEGLALRLLNPSTVANLQYDSLNWSIIGFLFSAEGAPNFLSKWPLCLILLGQLFAKFLLN